jgi:uncharacterized protein (DUF736 family)
MTEAKFNITIFKDTKNEKIDYSGKIAVKADQVDALIAYLKSATPNQYGDVEMRVAGWNKQSKSGTGYISAVASTPRQQYAAPVAAAPVASSEFPF